VRGVAGAFQIAGEFVEARPHGSGHIHETFVAVHARSAGARSRTILQRLNGSVFRDLEAMMDNVARVTAHQRAALERRRVPDAARRALTPIPTREGGLLHRDTSGAAWRAFAFVEGAHARDTVDSPRTAFEAARAFGDFLACLTDLPGPPLAVTIPHFHDLARRYAAFEAALAADPHGRAARAALAIDEARRRHERTRAALAAYGAEPLPRRVVHNDCKINNVLLDDASGEGLCVIDLDTVMEGTVLADFGDLARTATCPAPEDERDLSRVRFDPVLFAALARGYLAGARGTLCETERALLPIAGVVQSLENALRFLADHLEGDVYFRIHRPGQNLDRARAQLRLAAHMAEALDQSRRSVDEATQSTSVS
jgi:Ser/Thr protein kinase RdoA (MazF antagonist)